MLDTFSKKYASIRFDLHESHLVSCAMRDVSSSENRVVVVRLA